jgi:hypothetical protein
MIKEVVLVVTHTWSLGTMWDVSSYESMAECASKMREERDYYLGITIDSWDGKGKYSIDFQIDTMVILTDIDGSKVTLFCARL